MTGPEQRDATLPFGECSRRSAARGGWIASGLAVLASLPLLAPATFLEHVARPPGLLGLIVMLGVPAATLVGGWRLLAGEPPVRRALVVAGCLILSIGMTEFHRVSTDEATYPGLDHDNTVWQITLQDSALARDGGAVPHVYRYLPMTTMALLEQATGSFGAARRVYRIAFTFALLIWIVRFARAFAGPLPALAVPLAYVALYPITIRLYAGQPTDPMSHLSFVMAFAALAAGAYGPFFVALALGTLAKESVLALAGFYMLFHVRHDPAWRWRVPLAAAGCLAALLAPRLWTIGGAAGYASISGVDPTHVATNLASWPRWGPQLLLSVGLLVPFALLGWRRADPLLTRLTLFLTPAILLSSLVFSWLHEARNYVPLMILLATVGAMGFTARPGTAAR